MASSKFGKQKNRAVPPPICIKPPQPPVDYPNRPPVRMLASVTWSPVLWLGIPFDVRQTFVLEMISSDPVHGLWFGETGPTTIPRVYAFDQIRWSDNYSLIAVYGTVPGPLWQRAWPTPFALPTDRPYYTRNMVAYPEYPNPTVRIQISA